MVVLRQKGFDSVPRPSAYRTGNFRLSLPCPVAAAVRCGEPIDNVYMLRDQKRGSGTSLGPMSMKRMRDIPNHDRPREKLAARGPQALTDAELIALLLGRGVKGRDVSQIAGDVERYLKNAEGSPSYDALLAIEGVGAAKACEIMACFELGRRYLADDGVSGSRITCPRDVLPLIAEWRDRKQEYFFCITLNGAGEVIERRTITVGILNQSLVHPREVFAEAITDRAASVILAHNHPSGTLEPSTQDISITRQLVEAGSILGIRVLDHVIVTKKGYVSLKELGHL